MIRHLKFICFVVGFIICSEALSQCVPGPFETAPGDAVELNVCIEPVNGVVENACFQADNDPIPPNDGGGFTILTLNSGTQNCFILPFDGNYSFQTCFIGNNDPLGDSQITVFDPVGNILATNDDGCGGLNSFIFFPGRTAGETVCVQVCEGLASTENNPTFDLGVSCPFGETLTDFQEDGPLECSGTLLFDEVQELIDDEVPGNTEGLISTFSFSTGDVGDIRLSGSAVTICAAGDLGGFFETYTLNDEMGNCIGGINQQINPIINDDCAGLSCNTFNISEDDLLTYLADGVVTFDVLDIVGVIGNFCPETSLSVQFSICGEVIPIPTLGEWGLMAMALLLLIVGVLYARQSSIALRGINEG